METTLTERLKQARKRAKLRQEDLAELVGISQSSYSSLEGGKWESSGMLPEIAHALGVDTYALKTGDGWEEQLSDSKKIRVLALAKELPKEDLAEIVGDLVKHLSSQD